MKIILASYVVTKEFTTPETWLNRISMYAGVLESLSVTNEVISIEKINYEGEYFKNGVNYHFMKPAAIDKYLPFKLHRFIKDQHPDVVIIQGTHFPLQVIQLRFKLGPKTKIIVQNHAELPFTGIKKFIQRWADRCIDAYLFASREMGLDWIKKGNMLSPEKIYEVMEVSSVFYPIEKTTAKSKTGASGNPVFLWVGRLNANKDPFTVIKAFLRFAEVHPNATLYMIYHTDDLLPDIIEFLKDHPYKDNIILIGKVPNNELLYWYNSADFIISGSHYEGSGTAVAEAMSCGCVPVVTDIFSFRMITDNGKCGFLYKAGNEIALLATLINLKHIKLDEKRAASLAYFKSNLSFDAIAAKIQEIAGSL